MDDATMNTRYLMGTTALPRFVRAFDPGMPLAPPGSPDGMGLVRQMRVAVAAAEASAGQYEAPKPDLGTPSRDWLLMCDYWDLTDDLVTGYDALKIRGVKYLPKFADEATADYEARLAATEYTNIYLDIIESLAGKPFEEPVALVEQENKEPPPDIKDFITDVDGAGNDITQFAANTFFNGINSAIDWIFIDYPNVDASVVRNRADAKAQNIRPFWSHVLGRNVLEATTMVIGSKETLVRVRIFEPGMPNHIRLIERMPDGIVDWGLFKEVVSNDGKTKTYVLVDSGEITIGIIPMVPFATGRRDGRTFRYFPPMRAAADSAKELYQQESALKWTKTMAAYPMLAANGIKPVMNADGKTPAKVAVGPNRVLYSIPDGQGNVGNWAYVSPDAAILKFLADDIKDTMEQLRELGRQPLSAQSANLTVITTAFAAGKAKTAVGAWCMVLKNALENALVLTALWLSIKDYDPEVKVYNDFDDYSTDQAADQSALQFARTNRDLSHKNYIREQKRRNVISPDMDEDENDQQLLDEVPSDDNTLIDDGAGNVDPNAPKPKPKNTPDPSKVPPTKKPAK